MQHLDAELQYQERIELLTDVADDLEQTLSSVRTEIAELRQQHAEARTQRRLSTNLVPFPRSLRESDE